VIGEAGARVRVAIALAAFCASGFAALLYQVSWQRLLAIFSGADIHAATVIVAAFMAGLGLGHLAGGHVADRVSRRTSLMLFGAAECAIAAFGAISAGFYYDVLYQRLGASIAQEAMPLVLFGSLLWPTFFMGASLPLLARALTDRIEDAAPIIGALYGLNTLGAAAGALTATWVLMPQFGLAGSLHVGVMLNVACIAAIVPLAFSPSGPAAEPGAARIQTPLAVEPGVRALPVWFWASMYGLAGFVALSLEIVWVRLLGVMMKSTAFTFGTLLALYLAAIGVGALAGSRIARRARRPGLAFFACQAAGGFSAALLLSAFVGVAGDIGALRDYFAGYEPLDVRRSIDAFRTGAVPANFLRLYVAVPVVLIVPPMVLMGCSFAFLQRVVQTDLERVGRRVGMLLMSNIAGSIMGAILTGRVALTVLGTAGTLTLLAAMSGLFLLPALALLLGGSLDVARGRWRSGRVAAASAATAAAVAILVAAMPDGERLWGVLHGSPAAPVSFAEDDSGLSVIKTEPPGSGARHVVFVNGMGQSVIPYGGIHTALGALPALVHPNPATAAIIGLGSGDTCYAVAGRPELERIACIEIIRPQLATLSRLTARDSYGALGALLQDPRIEHVVGDGRAFLMRTRQTYDIIEADALRPTSAYAGNLYSEEYFRLLRDRLNANGLAATWVPSVRVHATFTRVFPYVISAPGILLGSSQPIRLDRPALAARIADARVREHYRRAGIDIEELMARYLAEPGRYGPDFDRTTLTDFNTDLFPRDEYDLSAIPR
jgi:spermidine synthase